MPLPGGTRSSHIAAMAHLFATGISAYLRRLIHAGGVTVIALAFATTPGAGDPARSEIVVDLADGHVLHWRDAATRRHPASLTKLMTLYLAYEAIASGRVAADSMVEISPNAADQPPSDIDLVAGSRARLERLIEAVAVKSANDAAVAIAEGLSGSEAAFVDRMNATARRLGMTDTRYHNSHGLTHPGHLTTARDTARLARRLLLDFPAYRPLYAQKTLRRGGHDLPATNIRFLSSYPGAFGLKTGFTRAAGYTLVGAAERDDRRLITVLLGTSSSRARAQRASALLDKGFAMPARARPTPPAPLAALPGDDALRREFLTMTARRPALPELVGPAGIPARTLFRSVPAPARPRAARTAPTPALTRPATAQLTPDGDKTLPGTPGTSSSPQDAIFNIAMTQPEPAGTRDDLFNIPVSNDAADPTLKPDEAPRPPVGADVIARRDDATDPTRQEPLYTPSFQADRLLIEARISRMLEDGAIAVTLDPSTAASMPGRSLMPPLHIP